MVIRNKNISNRVVLKNVLLLYIALHSIRWKKRLGNLMGTKGLNVSVEMHQPKKRPISRYPLNKNTQTALQVIPYDQVLHLQGIHKAFVYRLAAV